jgi:DNA-binding transcriptional LysR family regulator
MNFRQLEAFRAVMLTGSATAAAKMLFITQPAVSRLLSDLEHQTKLTLFIRKANRLLATPEAQTFYREVERAFIGLNEVKRSADAIINKQQGRLRIVATPVCIDSFIPPLIADFIRKYPNISIELESAARVQALDSVRTQRLDIAIVPLTHKEDLGLKTKTFCHQEAVCVLPKNHTLCDKKFITAHDLSKEKIITLSRGSPFRVMLDKVFGAEDINNSCLIETRTQKTIYELVKLGIGIAILDPFITNASDTEVVIKKFKPKISWEYAVVQAHSIPPSLITKAFIELLINEHKN